MRCIGLWRLDVNLDDMDLHRWTKNLGAKLDDVGQCIDGR